MEQQNRVKSSAAGRFIKILNTHHINTIKLQSIYKKANAKCESFTLNNKE